MKVRLSSVCTSISQGNKVATIAIIDETTILELVVRWEQRGINQKSNALSEFLFCLLNLLLLLFFLFLSLSFWLLELASSASDGLKEMRDEGNTSVG